MSPITFNRSKNFDEIKTFHFYFQALTWTIFEDFFNLLFAFFTLTVKMQNISDLSFHEFGNSEAFEEETDLI